MARAAGVVVYAARLYGAKPRRLDDWTVYHPQLKGPLDYWRGFDALWKTGETIVNVEHDVELSATLVAGLVECEHPLCTYPYRLYFPSTHQHEPCYAQRVSTVGWHPPIDDCGRWASSGSRYVEPSSDGAPGDEWADYIGPGFCKVAPEARIAPLAQQPWQGVEMSVNAAVEGRWHVHWPEVEHYHR